MAGKNKTALDAKSLVEGYCWFTTDDGKFYIDAKNSSGTLSRILLNAGKADSLTTTTAGGVKQPIYWVNGKPAAITQTVGSSSQPVYLNAGVITACTDLSTVGLTHVGASQPTNTDYVLWVDTDEPDAVIGYEIYTGPSQPTEESYDLWIDTSKEADVSLPASETMRKDAIKYKTFSIATSAWSGSGPYTWEVEAPGITANTAILNLTLDAASQTYQKAQLDWETGANFIKLSTAIKPTNTISGYLIATEVTVI